MIYVVEECYEYESSYILLVTTNKQQAINKVNELYPSRPKNCYLYVDEYEDGVEVDGGGKRIINIKGQEIKKIKPKKTT